MEALPALLGFTTTAGIVWNSIGYGGALLIITGIFWERARMWLFVTGVVMLTVYAFFFLGDRLLTILQVVAALPSVLQILKETPRRRRWLLGGVTGVALFALLAGGLINTPLQFLVIVGLLTISYGVISLPFIWAFPTMAFGGALIGVYAFETAAYAFLVLNVVYVGVNMWKWYRGFYPKRQVLN